MDNILKSVKVIGPSNFYFGHPIWKSGHNFSIKEQGMWMKQEVFSELKQW